MTPNNGSQPDARYARAAEASALGAQGNSNMITKILDNVSFVRLYRDLSYADFFSEYNAHRDGRVIGATYSLEHRDFEFWMRFEPFSVLFVDRRYRDKASALLKRFPLFLVYSVPHLHTKAFFFEKSCRLLLGSQNLYSPTPTFAELMCELWIDESDREETLKLVFDYWKSGELLRCRYGLEEIRLHDSEEPYLNGRPFLPCHREVTYWDLISSIVVFGQGLPKPPKPEFQSLVLLCQSP
jgi:hypothetical protein